MKGSGYGSGDIDALRNTAMTFVRLGSWTANRNKGNGNWGDVRYGKDGFPLIVEGVTAASFELAQYIATFDPPTVLKLLDLLDAKDRELAGLQRDVDAATRQHARLAAKLDAVRELHFQARRGDCFECASGSWPCPTIKAIDGES